MGNDSQIRPIPLLMIPLRRCGSHAIRLRLNRSQQFYSPYPLHIVDFMPLVQLYGDLHDDASYRELIVDLVGLVEVSLVRWESVILDPGRIFERVRLKPRNIHVILWEILFEAATPNSPRVVMDKSLDSVHYAEQLLASIPGIRFLHVARDPRAQVNSMNRAIIHEFDSLLNAQLWRHAQDAAAELIAKVPDRVLSIRYEDFLRAEEKVLRQICDFVEIDFRPEMLTVEQSVEALEMAQLSALWASNPFSPIPAYIDKFKQSLTLAEIEVIETVAGSYMDRFGYERLTPGNSKIDNGAWTDAKRASAERKRVAWAALESCAPGDYGLRRRRSDYIEGVSRRLRTNRDLPPSQTNRTEMVIS